MKPSDLLSILTHILNFAIILYFTSFLIGKDLLSLSDLIISFAGLFASLIVNIYSAIERNRER